MMIVNVAKSLLDRLASRLHHSLSLHRSLSLQELGGQSRSLVFHRPLLSYPDKPPVLDLVWISKQDFSLHSGGLPRHLPSRPRGLNQDQPVPPGVASSVTISLPMGLRIGRGVVNAQALHRHHHHQLPHRQALHLLHLRQTQLLHQRLRVLTVASPGLAADPSPRGLSLVSLRGPGSTGQASPLSQASKTGLRSPRGPTSLKSPRSLRSPTGPISPTSPRSLTGLRSRTSPRGPTSSRGRRGRRGLRGQRGLKKLARTNLPGPRSRTSPTSPARTGVTSLRSAASPAELPTSMMSLPARNNYVFNSLFVTVRFNFFCLRIRST